MRLEKNQHFLLGLQSFLGSVCPQGQADSSTWWGVCHPTVFASRPSSAEAGEQLQTSLSPTAQSRAQQRLPSYLWHCSGSHSGIFPIQGQAHDEQGCNEAQGLSVQFHWSSLSGHRQAQCPAWIGVWAPGLFLQIVLVKVLSTREFSTKSHLSVNGKAGFRCHLCWSVSRLMQGE